MTRWWVMVGLLALGACATGTSDVEPLAFYDPAGPVCQVDPAALGDLAMVCADKVGPACIPQWLPDDRRVWRCTRQAAGM